jgi:hypothetical protein
LRLEISEKEVILAELLIKREEIRKQEIESEGKWE